MKIEDLDPLSDSKKAVFVALICERMLPLYERFSNECRFGDSDLYREGISWLYSYALGEEQTPANYREKLNQIESLVPDLDDFSEPIASFGFDAALCLLEAVSFLADRDGLHIVNASTHALDTVDMFVQQAEELDPGDEHLESKIQKSTFMVNEIRRQDSARSILRTQMLNQ